MKDDVEDLGSVAFVDPMVLGPLGPNGPGTRWTSWPMCTRGLLNSCPNQIDNVMLGRSSMRGYNVQHTSD